MKIEYFPSQNFVLWIFLGENVNIFENSNDERFGINIRRIYHMIPYLEYRMKNYVKMFIWICVFSKFFFFNGMSWLMGMMSRFSILFYANLHFIFKNWIKTPFNVVESNLRMSFQFNRQAMPFNIFIQMKLTFHKIN